MLLQYLWAMRISAAQAGTKMVPQWYYDGTTMVIALQISTVLATLCQMKWCDVIKLMIQHLNQNQQAERVQRRRACIVHLFFVSKQQILTRDRQVWIGKDKVVIIRWARVVDRRPLACITSGELVPFVSRKLRNTAWYSAWCACRGTNLSPWYWSPGRVQCGGTSNSAKSGYAWSFPLSEPNKILHKKLSTLNVQV